MLEGLKKKIFTSPLTLFQLVEKIWKLHFLNIVKSTKQLVKLLKGSSLKISLNIFFYLTKESL